MNVLEAVNLKRAVRQFTSQQLSDETIHIILNAGRRSQSSKNTQPWNFIAITDRLLLARLSECGKYAGHLAGAALGVAIAHADPGEKFQLMFDIGQTAAYMQLAAWELGIGSCIASIYDSDMARHVLDYPNDMVVYIAISFGYPQDPDLLSHPPRKGGRFPFNQTVHWNKW